MKYQICAYLRGLKDGSAIEGGRLFEKGWLFDSQMSRMGTYSRVCAYLERVFNQIIMVLVLTIKSLI